MQEPLITISLSEYERLKAIEEEYEKKQRKEMDKAISDIKNRVGESLRKQMEEEIENFDPFKRVYLCKKMSR